jgi:hypothetical protein
MTDTVQSRMNELAAWKQAQTDMERPPYIDENGVDVRVNYVHHMEQEALEAADIGSFLASNFTPRHIGELEKLTVSDEEKLDFLSLYEGAEWQPFTKYLNTVVEIKGAIIWYHPAYKGMPDSEGRSQVKPGYYKILFLTTKVDADGVPVVIACSSSALAAHVLAMLNIRGWYIWPVPVKYKFLQSAQGMPFRMLHVKEEDKKHAE